MRQSQLFTKTRKEAPKDEVAKNAQLLIRAGYIHKEMAGAYDFLPLGLRVFNNICRVIREEMNKIGGVEVSMTALQDKGLWETTNRWSDEIVDIWFKSNLKAGGEVGLGFTHEEPMTRMVKDHVQSYKDLPAYPYQIQLKFRNELRAKSGIMRGREFIMKDLYSFSRNEEEHEKFYEKAKEAYMNVFSRVGLGDKTVLTFASGGVFSKYSHEFQTITEAGEDTIYYSKEKGLAVNKEVYTDEVLAELGLSKEELTEVSAAEVGNIFTLGTRFSEPLGLTFMDEDETRKPVVMGSYGIGPGRVMGTVVEALADEKGLVWPEEIAPFAVHLVSIGDVSEQAEDLYKRLEEAGVSVLFDDRDISPGKKFGDSDLFGIPNRVVISPKTLEKESVEVSLRSGGEAEFVPVSEVLSRFAK